MPPPHTESTNFELGPVVTRGRSGPIHRALDAEGRAAVIKFFADPGNAEIEARMLRSIDHPSVVQLIGRGIDENGRHWLATPVVEGQTLASVIEREAPLPLDRVRTLIDRLAEPVDALHRNGVVHADLSPHNIIIGAGDEVTILDLGAAHRIDNTMVDNTDRSLTRTRTVDVRTTPRYASPEVVGGSLPVPASDCYAVGLLAYEMATGAFPYPAVGTPIAMLGHHASTAPLPASDHQPELPPGVDRALSTALAKDPQDRPPTIAAFAAALRRDDGGIARSTETLRPRFLAGKQTAFGVAATLLGLGLAALVWSADDPSWEAGRAASLACNALTEPGFEAATLPIDFYGEDPTNVVALAPGAGLDATAALRVGGSGQFGLFGEIVPVRPGVEYTFSVWVRSPSAPETAGVYIDWLAADYSQLTQRRDQLQIGDSIGSPEGSIVAVAASAPAEAAFAVPTTFKDGSTGTLLIDEAVFGEANACPDLES